MNIGDLIQARECEDTKCSCPFCFSFMQRTGIVLEKWVDLDDNPSVIAVFGSEEMVIRENTRTPWMDFKFYEVLNK